MLGGEPLIVPARDVLHTLSCKPKSTCRCGNYCGARRRHRERVRFLSENGYVELGNVAIEYR
jgi:hypothetical protein